MIERSLQKIMDIKLDSGKAIIIMGARQVGNTLWINGDEPDVQALFQNINSRRLKLLFAGKKRVIIDEAQRIPDIGLKLKLKPLYPLHLPELIRQQPSKIWKISFFHQHKISPEFHLMQFRNIHTVPLIYKIYFYLCRHWFFCRHPEQEIKGNRVEIPDRPRCCKLHAQGPYNTPATVCLCTTGRRTVRSKSEDLPVKAIVRTLVDLERTPALIYLLYC